MGDLKADFLLFSTDSGTDYGAGAISGREADFLFSSYAARTDQKRMQ